MKNSMFILFLVLCLVVSAIGGVVAVRANSVRNAILASSEAEWSKYSNGTKQMILSEVWEQNRIRSRGLYILGAGVLGGVVVTAIKVSRKKEQTPFAQERAEINDHREQQEEKRMAEYRSSSNGRERAVYEMCAFADYLNMPIPPGYTKKARENAYVDSDEGHKAMYEAMLHQIVQMGKIEDHVRVIKNWIVFFGVVSVIGIVAYILLVLLH